MDREEQERVELEIKQLRRKLPKRKYAPRRLPIFLSDEEFEKVLASAKKRHHKVAFLLGFCSGLRISEVVKLKKEDVDMKSKSIFIREAKFGKDRIVPLPRGFSDKSLACIPFKFKNVKSGSRSLEIAFKRALAKAGINRQDLHFHSLRHSFATHCIEKGIPIHQVQLLMGHSNVSATGIYLRANPLDALKSYEEKF